MSPGRDDQGAHVRGSDTPFRDHDRDHDYDSEDEMSRAVTQGPVGQEPDARFLAQRSQQPQFTLRALLLGLAIGVLIAFSNTYFGLQTGWISGMAMPSALVGFAYFKGLRVLMGRLGDGFTRYGFGEGFSEVENVLVQTVAGSVGTMPLGCGFVGVVPALEFLLKPSETPQSGSDDPDIVAALAMSAKTGGLKLPLGKLVLWALGICFFGVVFAVPLRKEVIVREKLKFPSGTATALMIGVLHGGEKQKSTKTEDQENEEEGRALMGETQRDSHEQGRGESQDEAAKRDWKRQIRLLTYSFSISGVYVCLYRYCPASFICDMLTCCRPSPRTLFLSFTTSPLLGTISHATGSGHSTLRLHTLDRASSWARPLPFTCFSVLYSAGQYFRHWPNTRAGQAAMSAIGTLVQRAGSFGSAWRSCLPMQSSAWDG